MFRKIINWRLLCLIFIASLSMLRNTSADDASEQTILKVELGKPRIDLGSHGDVWDASWADDGHLYASSDDTRGFNNQPGRNLQFHILRGDTPDQLVGETINRMDEYLGSSKRGPDGCMWKANGNTCIDGNLYAFVSRHGLDFNKRQSAVHASLILSTDKGRTWQRTAKENYDHPMFPGPRFGSPLFIKYGQDGRAEVHNADKYVYALANNGFWENGDDMILGRVLKTQIARLKASDWQFYLGGEGMLDASWSLDVQKAKPVLANPGKCSMTGAQYIAPLKKYLMIQWYYTTGSGHKAPKDTTWLFYEATSPWGPWRQFQSQRFDPEGYYNPCIVPKFISPDGRHLTIFTNGDFFTAGEKGEKCLYRLTIIPCTITLGPPEKQTVTRHSK